MKFQNMICQNAKITAKDVQQFMQVGRNTAYKRIKIARQSVGRNALTIAQFCEFYGLKINL